jgi:hypothetical protein
VVILARMDDSGEIRWFCEGVGRTARINFVNANGPPIWAARCVLRTRKQDYGFTGAIGKVGCGLPDMYCGYWPGMYGLPVYIGGG